MKRLALVALIAGLSACGSELPPSNEPTPGFGDVTTYCLEGFRVFVTKDDIKATSAIAAVPDPKCGPR